MSGFVRRLFFRATACGPRIGGRMRGLWITLRLRAIGGQVGRRLTAAPGARVITAPGAVWRIGDNVTLASGALIYVRAGARLDLGDDVRIMHYALIGAEQHITVADHVQVAERASVRDHDHDVTAPSLHGAPPVCAPVHIGADAWIGAGVAVLRGTTIGAGAVVGANAVVRGDIPARAVAVGAPARVVRFRDTDLTRSQGSARGQRHQ
jgi:acetyltransferase-like isoleucine patch superfamily enzyme